MMQKEQMKLKSTATKKKGFDKSKAVINLVNHGKLTPHLERAIGEGEFPWEYKFEEKEDDDAWHPSGHCIPSTAELYKIAQESNGWHQGKRKACFASEDLSGRPFLASVPSVDCAE